MRKLRELKACIYLIRRALRQDNRVNPVAGLGMSLDTSDEHVDYLNARIEALERELKKQKQ